MKKRSNVQGMAAVALLAAASSRCTGEGQPVAGNDTAAGRQMNRRVEVVFAPQAGVILTR